MESFLGKCLVIQHKSVVLPKKAFDFIALSVGEHVQRPTERIVAQLVFDQR